MDRYGRQPDIPTLIEDSERGLEAAKAACMKSIGIKTTHTRKELNNADKIIDFFAEIKPEILNRL